MTGRPGAIGTPRLKEEAPEGPLRLDGRFGRRPGPRTCLEITVCLYRLPSSVPLRVGGVDSVPRLVCFRLNPPHPAASVPPDPFIEPPGSTGEGGVGGL